MRVKRKTNCSWAYDDTWVNEQKSPRLHFVAALLQCAAHCTLHHTLHSAQCTLYTAVYIHYTLQWADGHTMMHRCTIHKSMYSVTSKQCSAAFDAVQCMLFQFNSMQYEHTAINLMLNNPMKYNISIQQCNVSLKYNESVTWIEWEHNCALYCSFTEWTMVV